MSGDLVRNVVEEGCSPVDATVEQWSVSNLDGRTKIIHLEGIVEPGPPVTLAYVPTLPTSVRQIFVKHRIGQYFEIVDVMVGTESQLLIHDPIPAEFFEHGSAGPVDPVFDIDPCTHERPFALTVRNISGVTRTFSSALVVKVI